MSARDRGAAVLEFSLLLPLALLLLFGTLILGSNLLYSTTADNKARDLARYASVPQTLTGMVSYPDTAGAAGGCGATTAAMCSRGVGGGFPGNPTSIVVQTCPATPTTPATEDCTLPARTGQPRQADLVRVTVSYRNPFAAGLGGIVGAVGLDPTGFTTTTHTATARRE